MPLHFQQNVSAWVKKKTVFYFRFIVPGRRFSQITQLVQEIVYIYNENNEGKEKKKDRAPALYKTIQKPG